MKKLWLISALSLGLVFVAGCTLGTQQSEWSSDVMWVYKQAEEMTCIMTYSAEMEEWTSTIYVKNGMIKQDTTATVDGETYSTYETELLDIYFLFHYNPLCRYELYLKYQIFVL